MKIDEARAAAKRFDIGTQPEQLEAAAALAAALDEIEYACANMNAGAPGWTLRNRILDILAGVRS